MAGWLGGFLASRCRRHPQGAPAGSVVAERAPAPLSEAVQWQLVATVFEHPRAIVVGGLGLLFLIVIGWHQTHDSWFLGWGLAAVIAFGGRLAVQIAFRRRRDRTDRVRYWRARGAAGLWAIGAVWGAPGLAVVCHSGAPVFIIELVFQSVIVLASAALNAGCPGIAKVQVGLATLPPIVALLVAGGEFNDLLVVALLCRTFGAHTLIDLMNRRLIGFLCANERNEFLVNEIRRANGDLEDANRRLAVAAATDALTGIANRRSFDSVMTREAARTARERVDISVLMIDIDNFKRFNDRYGHQAGDECLRRTASALTAMLYRPADFIARLGGEEFVAVLPGTDCAGAAVLAERMRAAIETLSFIDLSADGPVTVSIGVATSAAGNRGPLDDLVRAADAALYAAKNAGRNCVCSAADVARASPAEGAIC